MPAPCTPSCLPESPRLNLALLSPPTFSCLPCLLPPLHLPPLQGRDRLLYAVFASCELETRTAPLFKV